MRPDPPPTRLILRAAGVALLVALGVAYVVSPSSASGFGRTVELGAIVILGLGVLTGVVALVTRWLAGWEQSEPEFELLVQRTERLAVQSAAVELDPLEDADFEELVRDALDELPDLLRNALAHVAVVISDRGREMGAYGLYQGDGPHRDDHHDRIVIFRDTLRRDFGHDADLLREQVVRVVRHELAHHVGFDEMGVSGLGL
ncbi:MAG: metallopeptidase family protein [Solirubrobacteraceae bacterium]